MLYSKISTSLIHPGNSIQQPFLLPLPCPSCSLSLRLLNLGRIAVCCCCRRRRQVRRRSLHCSLSTLYYLPKHFRIANRQIRQDLPIQPNIGFMQRIHQPTVGQAIHPCRRIDPQDPQPTKLPLAISPIAIRVLPAALQLELGDAKGIFSSSPVTLRLLKDFLSALTACRSICRPGHCLKILPTMNSLHQRLNPTTELPFQAKEQSPTNMRCFPGSKHCWRAQCPLPPLAFFHHVVAVHGPIMLDFATPRNLEPFFHATVGLSRLGHDSLDSASTYFVCSPMLTLPTVRTHVRLFAFSILPSLP